MSKETEQIMGNIGKKPAIVFSFDTTGSMAPCINNVRANIKELAEKLFEEIPGLKMGLIAHGDYCDGEKCYQYVDLTNDIGEIIKFIDNNHNTSGGDAPECYEYVLQRAIELSWPEEGGTLVMIGDDAPHDANYYNGGGIRGYSFGGSKLFSVDSSGNQVDRTFIDWEVELKNLKDRNIEVFAVQCLKQDVNYRKEANSFWEGIGQIAGTPLIIMENFKDSYQTLGSITRATLSTNDADFESYNATTSCSVADSATYGSNVSKLAAFRSAKYSK
jgi:hypothetical protein